MRLPINCPQCFPFPKLRIPSDELILVEPQEGKLYKNTCVRGHEFFTLLQNPKFEILFEIGAHAIIDGYYREAVTSFTSSYEEFCKYFVCVLLKSTEIEKNIYDQCIKNLFNRSEKISGAFIASYIFHFSDFPETMKNDDVTFRNKVVHKGYIPSKKQALAYGNKLLKIIGDNLSSLKNKYSDQISSFTYHELIKENSQKSATTGTMCLGTIFSTTKATKNCDTLDKHLENLVKWKSIFNY